MWRNKLFLGVMCLAIFLVAIPTANAEEVIISEDFELGIPPGWGADNGVWELCMPEEGDPGPQESHGGYFCAATVCKGDYPDDTNSRFISPSLILPEITGNEEIHLRFWQWFSYSNYNYTHAGVHHYDRPDKGHVQISVYDDDNGTWLEWETLSSIQEYSLVWSLKDENLTAYAGQKVRIGFYHTESRHYSTPSVSTGWYIDHIRITGFPHFCECDLNQDGRCDMQDWLLFGEDWGRTDCGTPPGSGYWPNDCECDLNHDGSCDMQDWLRFGEDWGQTDCLICE